MEKLAIVLCIILIVQYGLSFIQIKYYRKSMDSLIDDYRGNKAITYFQEWNGAKLALGPLHSSLWMNRISFKNAMCLAACRSYLNLKKSLHMKASM